MTGSAHQTPHFTISSVLLEPTLLFIQGNGVLFAAFNKLLVSFILPFCQAVNSIYDLLRVSFFFQYLESNRRILDNIMEHSY